MSNENENETETYHSTAPEYGEKNYWENRYKKGVDNLEIYDWYQDYENCIELKNFINKWISKESKILIVGCGNSLLGEHMYKDGYKEIISIDFSIHAIDIMKKRAEKQNLPLDYRVLDARNLTSEFGINSFDAVIDKGTFDAMMCGKNNTLNVSRLCEEVSKVLKKGGIFLEITYGKPDSRLEYLDPEKYGWELQYTTISKNDNSFHHIYWMIKI
jgi:SAM-dependent methyltransferase